MDFKIKLFYKYQNLKENMYGGIGMSMLYFNSSIHLTKYYIHCDYEKRKSICSGGSVWNCNIIYCNTHRWIPKTLR